MLFRTKVTDSKYEKLPPSHEYLDKSKWNDPLNLKVYWNNNNLNNNPWPSKLLTALIPQINKLKWE